MWSWINRWRGDCLSSLVSLNPSCAHTLHFLFFVCCLSRFHSDDNSPHLRAAKWNGTRFSICNTSVRLLHPFCCCFNFQNKNKSGCKSWNIKCPVVKQTTRFIYPDYWACTLVISLIFSWSIIQNKGATFLEGISSDAFGDHLILNDYLQSFIQMYPVTGDILLTDSLLWSVMHAQC